MKLSIVFNWALNKIHAKLKESVKLFQRISYSLPFSAFRGIIWLLIDKSSRRILDVGCEEGGLAALIRLRNREKVCLIGVDLHLPYLKRCKAKGLYDALVLCDARHLPFKSKSFGSVVAIELIEHLSKNDGYILINELERSGYQIILTTPTREIIRFATAYAETDLQRHRFIWDAYKFAKMGYKVRGMVGPTFLPQEVAYSICQVLPLAWFSPRKSHIVVCTKHVNKATGHRIVN